MHCKLLRRLLWPVDEHEVAWLDVLHDATHALAICAAVEIERMHLHRRAEQRRAARFWPLCVLAAGHSEGKAQIHIATVSHARTHTHTHTHSLSLSLSLS